MTLQFNQTNITNFLLDVPDAGITDAFRLNVQTALIPGISIPTINTPLGKKGLGRANRPGTTFEFEPLVCRVLIDEKLDAWTDIYTWMLSLNNYLTHDNNGVLPGVLPDFISLHILSNDKVTPLMTIHYHNAWPQLIGDLEFNYTEEADPAIFANVTFQYSHFTVEKNGVIIETRKSISDMLTNGSREVI
ncbi:tail completion and sheath stabilizer protein [Acinetobacter phage vB_AbaM_PhT2]|uniref:Tail completion and sheath stabilizer protein n=2 Tax=Hadassahvirus TaxID=2842716 RepID=A0A6B9SY18_9CAUD|nr:tail completion protein [Acinetobacter phage AbTZA1]YP_009887197.1 tail completion and sheath stabilizer protein [Acinetobacter phage vB_AbaM_PhT2]QQO96352.1 tail sheath stabilizer protein [Acinetobacter phage Minot]QQO96600.1 tail tube terminator protein [Acinetobacter phage Mokit]QQO96855.1 tail completion and sheath stabilizer protein [Acinetobacter phage Melin]SSU39188.1 T4-like virus tail tube protein gp19 [Acinetobacter baumannii]AZU98612.1 tail completion protein [Acinetobacter phag